MEQERAATTKIREVKNEVAKFHYMREKEADEKEERKKKVEDSESDWEDIEGEWADLEERKGPAVRGDEHVKQYMFKGKRVNRADL